MNSSDQKTEAPAGRIVKNGPDGFNDAWNGGPQPRLSVVQKAELDRIVKTGPDPAVDGVVRWRRVDLQSSSRNASASTITSVTSGRC